MDKMRNEETRVAEQQSFVHICLRIILFLHRRNVPITWLGVHLIQISLVSAPSLDSSGSVVRHKNSWCRSKYASAVAFAGHSMAATSICTPVFVISNDVVEGGGNVTRVP